MNERLEAVYRATSYIVDGPDGEFAIRIDEPSPHLDELLLSHASSSWAFITAWNPGSVPLPEEENRRRADELESWVIEAGYACWPGRGVADSREWPPEKSLLILGITPENAAALGRRFGQNAIVIGKRGGAAQLLWL